MSETDRIVEVLEKINTSLTDVHATLTDVHDALMVNFITNMRVYDVVMAQMSLSNPELATQVLGAHGDGTFIGPEPRMNYRFIFDEANAPPDQGRDEANAPPEGEANSFQEDTDA